jgi:hypothetical protein
MVPLIVMIRFADPVIGKIPPAEERTQAWESSASVLKDVIKTNATIMDVEACFLRCYVPDTLSLISYYLVELLDRA